MQRKMIIVNGVLAIAVVGLGVGAWSQVGGASSSKTTETVNTVKTGTVLQSVSATGSVASSASYTLNMAQAGKLTEVDVTVGQKVTKGQTLAKIDDTTQRNALAVAQANLRNAQNQLDTSGQSVATAQSNAAQNAIGYDNAVAQAQTSLDNTTLSQNNNLRLAQTDYDTTSATLATEQQTLTDLQNANASSAAIAAQQVKVNTAQTAFTKAQNALISTQIQYKQSLDNANNQLTNAQTNRTNGLAKDQQAIVTAQKSYSNSQSTSLVSPKQAVDTAQKNLDDTVLYAPADGTVTAVNYKVGDQVTASSGGGSGGNAASSSSGFMTLVDLKALQVKAGFSEADSAKVKVGQVVSVTFDALAGVRASGKVVSIDTVPTTVNNVVTYYAIVTLDSPDAQIKPGLTASVSVTVLGKENVLVLPTTAVTARGTNATVQVRKDGKLTPTQITIGLRGDETIEIASGLAAGDQVVTITTVSTGTNRTTTGTTGITGGLTGGNTGVGGGAGFPGAGGGVGGGAGGARQGG
jgi:macrolide-specific efflux system membrane fusion protein